MRIIAPSATILDDLDGKAILRKLELIGRVAYKSEDRITDYSAERFVHMLVHVKHHESVIEHVSVTVKFVVDRGVSHEIVRHRIASYTQESTRYCDYGKEDEGIAIIEPPGLDGSKRNHWLSAVGHAEAAYSLLRRVDMKPQIARAVLPTCLKTEIYMTANLREWRHFFTLRTSKSAHPQMREVAIPLLADFKAKIPVIFDYIEVA